LTSAETEKKAECPRNTRITRKSERRGRCDAMCCGEELTEHSDDTENGGGRSTAVALLTGGSSPKCRGSCSKHVPNTNRISLLGRLHLRSSLGLIIRRPDSRYGDSERISVPSFVSPKSQGGIGPLLHFFRFAPRVGRKIGSGVPRRSPNHNLPLRIFSVLFRPLAIILRLWRDAHQSHIRHILFHLIMFERPKNRIKIATL